MPEQIQSQKENINQKRPRTILRLIYVLLFLLIAGFIISRIFFYKTPQEQLAEIEKSLTIPDSENAAVLYLQIFNDYNESDFNPVFLTNEIETITRTTPWSSDDYPEITNWLKQNQNVVEYLMKLNQFDKCYFELPDVSEIKSYSIFQSFPSAFDIEFVNIVKKSVFFLSRSANNDIAEGRLENAIEKYLCVLQMSDHFREQPMTNDFLVGIALGAIGSHNIRNIIIHDDTTEEQIKRIETCFKQIPIQFEKQIRNINEVQKIIERIASSELSLREKFIKWYSGTGIKKREKEIYHRFSCDCHGNLIFIALKKYKMKTGKWPEKIDEIKPFLSSQNILIDPQNNGSFVYKLKDDSFILYSIGQNKIDENGQINSSADDWQIWPMKDSK